MSPYIWLKDLQQHDLESRRSFFSLSICLPFPWGNGSSLCNQHLCTSTPKSQWAQWPSKDSGPLFKKLGQVHGITINQHFILHLCLPFLSPALGFHCRQRGMRHHGTHWHPYTCNSWIMRETMSHEAKHWSREMEMADKFLTILPQRTIATNVFTAFNHH